MSLPSFRRFLPLFIALVGLTAASGAVRSNAADTDPGNNAATAVTRIERLYVVSSADDSGPGSLRAALDEANRECDPDGASCRILFRIPPPLSGAGYAAIRLASPLPPITAPDLVLEAGSSSPYPALPIPTVFLDGRLLEQGNGLEIRSAARFEVSGLAIGGFPENGILFDAPGISTVTSYLVAGNYIGTDPTGTIAIPNGLRGVAVFLETSDDPASTFPPAARLTIRSNVISGNGRSGIFVHRGPLLIAEDNRIGVAAAGDDPLPNGASGIYMGVAAARGCIDHNVIAYNAHFGIALERAVPNVWIKQNSIKANEIYGLDIGLDLATQGGSEGVIARPLLTSARYDASRGVTTILGRFPSETNSLVADLYANSSAEAKGEGETWIGEVARDPRSPQELFLEIPGNLLGKSVTATVTQTIFAGFAAHPSLERAAELPLCQQQGFWQQTSEFSDPIPVTD